MNRKQSMLGYQTFGWGSNVVIALHGWLGDHSTFDPLLPALDLSRQTWVCPAYRGYGVSRHLDGAYTVEEIAADCLALADALGAERFDLVGHSMGGKVIQRMLSLGPERVRRMIGVAPVPASGLPLDPDTRRLFAQAARSAEIRREIIAHSTGRRLSPYFIDRLVRRSFETTDAQAFAGYLPSWADEDFHALIAGSEVPVKLILGDRDPEMNEALMRRTWFAWYPNCLLETIPGGGHYLPDETPVALATSIQAFLESR